MTPSPSSPSFEPIFFALAALAALAYARAWRRERPPAARAAAFAAGLLLVVAAVNSPLETIAIHYLLLAHLVQNALIADWAPPLLVLGLSPAMRAAVRRRGGGVLAGLTSLPVALLLWMVGWYGVHLPTFYEYALRHPWALNLEHGLLLAIGLIFWWPVFAEESERRSPALVLPYLLVAFVGAAFLGLAFTFIPHAFYDYYVHAPRLWGISPVRDQNLAGIIMNGEQSIVFLAAIAYALFVVLEREHRRAVAQTAADAEAAQRPRAVV